ncbi:GlxA family transcriptional regulator [Williamsia muralis]|uniref:Helix-turn-helix domain-containing protein n=1 Tax=Williamsia marianensis TaxID=85044 RepID=A0ABU4EZI4_WILMA|nr:helix-turn-helix domain-containing protein [Williamsia muralis]MDV7136674.1 helix-turn-helix domain-containing protein [Williamsia muralis]
MASRIPTPHRIAVLMLEPVIGFDATIPPMVFGQAADDAGNPLYDVELIGLSTEPVRTLSGFAMVPTRGPEALDSADTVVIPGTRLHEVRFDGTCPAELRQVLERVRTGTRIVSICTGAFALAAAGLLDGRPATTHWDKADDLRRLYPAVHLDEDVLFVDDGDVLTSAGLAAGIDLCLHMIRRDHGARVANRVAKYCVVPPWRDGGQAQYIDAAVPDVGDASTSAVREWARHNLTEPLTVAQLARQSNMSVRTFNRRFREETGDTPAVWVRKQRVHHARELLESRDLPVDEVARLSGLANGANLRHHLRNHLGTSPTRYRRTFQGQ